MATITDETDSSQSLTNELENGAAYRNGTAYRSNNTYRGAYIYLSPPEDETNSSSATNLTDEVDES